MTPNYNGIKTNCEVISYYKTKQMRTQSLECREVQAANAAPNGLSYSRQIQKYFITDVIHTQLFRLYVVNVRDNVGWAR